MEKTRFSPTEIFRGVHDDFYKSKHKVQLNEKEYIQLEFLDFNFNALANPKDSDQTIINNWLQKSQLKIIKNIPFPEYKGFFGLPLNYCILTSNIYVKYLIILCFEETQPMVYRICIEEIWKL